jgi:hypothetical protein
MKLFICSSFHCSGAHHALARNRGTSRNTRRVTVGPVELSFFTPYTRARNPPNCRPTGFRANTGFFRELVELRVWCALGVGAVGSVGVQITSFRHHTDVDSQLFHAGDKCGALQPEVPGRSVRSPDKAIGFLEGSDDFVSIDLNENAALSENLERPNKRASFGEEAVRLDSGECVTTNSRKS